MKTKSVFYYLYPVLSLVLLVTLFILKDAIENVMNLNILNLQLSALKNSIMAIQIMSAVSLVLVLVDLLMHHEDIPAFKNFFLLGSGAFAFAGYSLQNVVALIGDIQSINLYKIAKNSYDIMAYDYSSVEVVILISGFLLLFTLLF